MTSSTAAATDRAWEAIEQDRKRDRIIRRVSVAAWSVTFVVVLLLVVVAAFQVRTALDFLGGAGGVGLMAAVGIAMPALFAVGGLAVLIATLSTVGIFLRLRTASLQEIQLRLAALEEALTASAAERESR
jgi:archaellum biogenesis protein FlaJ (TadC family)